MVHSPDWNAGCHRGAELDWSTFTCLGLLTEWQLDSERAARLLMTWLWEPQNGISIEVCPDSRRGELDRIPQWENCQRIVGYLICHIIVKMENRHFLEVTCWSNVGGGAYIEGWAKITKRFLGLIIREKSSHITFSCISPVSTQCAISAAYLRLSTSVP